MFLNLSSQSGFIIILTLIQFIFKLKIYYQNLNIFLDKKIDKIRIVALTDNLVSIEGTGIIAKPGSLTKTYIYFFY